MNNPEKDLEKALDESLDVLSKAAADDTISKAAKSEEDEDAKGDKKEDEDAKGGKPPFMKKKDKKDEDEDDEKKEPEDAKGDKKEEDEDAKGDKKEEDEAMRGGYRKSVEESLSKSETVANAIEVSKFLREMVKSLSDVVGDMKHRVVRLEKSNRALAEALVEANRAQVSVIKSMSEDISTMGGRPLPRKAIDGTKTQTIEKGFRNDEKGGAKDLSKGQISDRLATLEVERKVPYGTTTKFEMTGELNKSFEKLVFESDAK